MTSAARPALRQSWIPAFAGMTSAARPALRQSWIPAFAGMTSAAPPALRQDWIPAFAGMTNAARPALRQSRIPAFAGMTNAARHAVHPSGFDARPIEVYAWLIGIHGLFDHNTTATVSPACRAIIAASHRVNAQGTRLTGPANHRTGNREAARIRSRLFLAPGSGRFGRRGQLAVAPHR
jgi:hypothetical protein